MGKNDNSLKVSKKDLFEIAEDSIKLGQYSLGTALQEEILQQKSEIHKIRKLISELEDKFIKLSILAKAFDIKGERENLVLTEEETRTHLIDPIISILLSLSDSEMVREEWKKHSKGIYDYVIHSKDMHTSVVFEAKRYNKNILVTSKHDINAMAKGQMARYISENADVDGFGMAVIMNGTQLVVFLACHIDGEYQPMRNITRPIFSMSYCDATFDKCSVLAYLVNSALNNHKAIKNQIQKVYNHKMSELEYAISVMKGVKYGE